MPNYHNSDYFSFFGWGGGGGEEEGEGEGRLANKLIT